MEGLPSGIYIIKAFVVIYSVHDTCDDVNTTNAKRSQKIAAAAATEKSGEDERLFWWFLFFLLSFTRVKCITRRTLWLRSLRFRRRGAQRSSTTTSESSRRR